MQIRASAESGGASRAAGAPLALNLLALGAAAAEVAPADVPGEPKPGSVITVGKRLIPIPKNKPKT